MAQQGGRRKKAPAYSADTMALRYIAGLALAALGVMMFMAVDLNMSGNIFQGLRQVCFGISGGMAYVMPVLPLWAGGLVIWSTQRKAPVRPWIFALLSFCGICAFMILITRTSSGEYLNYLTNNKQLGWGNALERAYQRQASGGALGVIFAWPVWSLLGQVLGILIYFLATLFCLLMMVNLTPMRIKAIVTGQAGAWKQQKEAERIQAEQQQVAWQQQQAMQAQAWQQQQQYILEQQQQQQMQYRQQQQQAAQQQAQPQNMGWPAQSQAQRQSVEQWQEQMTANQTAATAPPDHRSRIFTPRPQQQDAKAGRSWKSRIFGKKEDEYDGLVGEEPAAPAVRQPQKTNERRTATGAKIGAPGTQWNLPDEAAEEEWKQRTAQPAKPAQPQPQPAQEAPVQPVHTAQPVKPVKPVQQRMPIDEAEEEPAPKIPATVNPDAYKRPSTEERKPAAEPDRRRRSDRAAVETQERPVVPVVQQTISKETYSPELKLKPSEKNPHTPEDDEWFPVPYNYPPITDLAMPQMRSEDTGAEDEMRSRKLEETLASFRVQAKVVHVTHGPAISRFEMELAAGTKVGKVAELEKDIAYGMEATSIRIEAPIPGKSLVGVEVPNRKVETVTLREVLQSEKMQSARSLLTVALGKDLTGTPIVCDLAKMPHMLIAGQTGSGKSVCINAIINSLLYRASPDEVKLILVDPKVVELQCYNGIPHLLIPVVNDPHKAAAALAWAVAEMMERYDKFAERKVRNLDGYNAGLKPGEKPMTRIVIIIDELADLMMVCKKDVEEDICRLTQLARAAGIHLIVATQRPSVDVITGLIKANIPSRIAFKTASYVDSRTILDRNGSEQLLGWGDMLYLPTGAFAPTRVQGCYLSDEEVNRIVKHVRDANPSTYDPNILEKVEEIASGGASENTGADMVGGEMGGGDGSLFEQAVEYAIQDGQISTSTLQRRLKIGYARAGRLTDEMEERGIVAAKDGSKPRKCLITREEWEEMKKSSEGLD